VGVIFGRSPKITPTYSLDHRNYQRTQAPLNSRTQQGELGMVAKDRIEDQGQAIMANKRIENE
jgi:hypothetical protein